MRETVPAPNVHRTALVFEGGGLRAAYSAGFVEALLEANINFEWVCGTSSATMHVLNYLSRDIGRNRKGFTSFPSTRGIAGIRPWLKGEGFFNIRLIFTDTALPVDWTTMAANPARYRITAFDAGNGEQAFWGREDNVTLDDFMLRARASSTLPFILPEAIVDGRRYFDGAFGQTGGIPTDAAVRDGFDRFLVVATRVRDYRKATTPLQSRLMDLFYRKYPLLVESFRNRHRRYNKHRAWLFEQEAQGKAYIFEPSVMNLTTGNRRLEHLVAGYEQGLHQAREEMPQIRKFLGLPESPEAGKP